MYRATPVAGLLLLAALTACSSSGGAKDPNDVSPPTVVCGEGQAPIDGACGNTPPEAPKPKSVRVGEVFEYREPTVTPQVWRVKVISAKCGLTAIPNGLDNPAWQGSDDVPERITARPAAGKVFCRADALLVNGSKTPVDVAPDFGNVVTDKGEFAPTDAENNIANNAMAAIPQATVNDGQPVNPGATTTLIGVWSIPVGATAESISFPSSNDNVPTHRISVS